MNPRILLRLARWVRKPPSRTQIIIGAIVLGASAALWGYEALFGWPEWATPQKSNLRITK